MAKALFSSITTSSKVVIASIGFGHPHRLPKPDSKRKRVVYRDGCRVSRQPDGGWLFEPKD